MDFRGLLLNNNPMSRGMPSTFFKFSTVLIALFSTAITFQNCANIKGLAPGESGNPYEGLRGDNHSTPPPKSPSTPSNGSGNSGSCGTPISQSRAILTSLQTHRLIDTVMFGKDSHGKEWMSLTYRDGNSGKCLSVSTSTADQNPDGSFTLNIALGIENETLMQVTFVHDAQGLVTSARFSFLTSVNSIRYEDFKK